MFPYHTISLFFIDLFYFKAKLNESKANCMKIKLNQTFPK